MMRWLTLLAAFLLCTAPALAEWSTDYHMGTFAAGAGSDAEGRITLECGDPDAGITFYGELYLTFTPAAGAMADTSKVPPYLDFDIDGEVFALPVQSAGSGIFGYAREAEGAALTQSLVKALRRGQILIVRREDTVLGTVDLAGSSAALKAIDACIRYRQ